MPDDKTDLDFSNLAAADVKGKHAWWPVPNMTGAVIQVRPTTEANPTYFNIVLRRTRGHVARQIAQQGVSPEMRSKWRHDDRDLFPRHVVIGWRGLRNAKGVEVPFTTEAARKLLAVDGLPDWMFDQLRSFCENDSNFVDDDVAAGLADPEALGKR